MILIGNILIICGMAITLAGMICYIYCRDFFGRLLVSSVIDSCGFLTIMAGAVCRFGFSLSALKVLLIVVIVMIINPATSHEIARLSKLGGLGESTVIKCDDDSGQL